MSLNLLAEAMRESNGVMKHYVKRFQELYNVVAIPNLPFFNCYDTLLDKIENNKITVEEVVLELVYLDRSFDTVYNQFCELKFEPNFLDDFNPYRILKAICDKDVIIENIEAFHEDESYSEQQIVDYLLLSDEEMNKKYGW